MVNPIADRVIVLHRGRDRDKRALVLFLFGLVLILVDFWPSVHKLETRHYGLQPDSHKQLIWTAPNQKKANFIPLSSNGIRNKAIAARYALFLFEPLAINRASQQDLELLPGVGIQLAKNIREFIAMHGTLDSVEDLHKISGIGPKKAQQLQPLITFVQDE